MVLPPHPDSNNITVTCAVVTISDTRTPETDKSGKLIQELLLSANHLIADYQILKDEPDQIQTHIENLSKNENIDVIRGCCPRSVPSGI